MTEINGMPAEGMEAAEPTKAVETVNAADSANAPETTSHVTVRLGKLVEGVSLMFAGVLTMLESLDAGTAKKLTEGFALNDAVETAPAADSVPAVSTAASVPAVPVDGTSDAENAENAGTKAEKTEKSEKSEKPETAKEQKTEKPETAAAAQPAPVPSITVDEVAKIVVQKVKANHGINDKIRALVNSYGAQRVTELKPEVLEAFLTDLSQL